MSRSIVFNVETQTENGEIVSLAHINEKSIALEVSQDANIIYKNNLGLFEKINRSTSFLTGKIVRHSVVKAKKRVNRCSVIVDDNYEYVEEEVAKLNFDNNNLRVTRRALLQGKKKADFNPNQLQASLKKNILDLDNITKDDLVNAIIVSQVEEINIFENIGVKTLMFTDNLSDKKNTAEVSYELELSLQTNFSQYVDFILSSLNSSIVFLSKYLNTIEAGKYYDYKLNKFSKSFVTDTMSQLQIDYSPGLIIDMSNNIISKSEFGIAANNFFNASLLLKPNVNKNIYKNIVKNLLPLDNNTVDVIKKSILAFENLYNQVLKEYGRTDSKLINNRKRSIISAKPFTKHTVISKSKEKFKIQRDKLGYNVFSNTSKGLNRLSSSRYRSRFLSEQERYYPSMNAGKELNILRPAEQSRFMNMRSAPSFLTPTSLIMGDEQIDTTRGLANINIDRVKEFKMLKSIKSAKMKTESFPDVVTPDKIVSNTLNTFNLTIGDPFKTVMDEKRETVEDAHIDAEAYVGPNSFFISANPTIIRLNIRKILQSKNKTTFNIISEIMPMKFLKNPIAITQLDQIQLSNPKSRISGLISKNKISINSIPPHIKVMALDSFAQNQNVDPVKNISANTVLSETMQNVFMVRALVGFEKGPEGFVDINRPIYRPMSLDILNSGRPILAKAFDYELPELGIVKDKLSTTIYNNLIYIRG